MGIIEDITKIMRKGPETVHKINSMKLNKKSIAQRAKDATFQYPCLVSNSISLDMANTIARTLDQVYASFTQTVLSMNSMFDITIDPTPLDYLKRLHQNLKLESVDSTSIDKYIDKIYNGDCRLYMNEECTEGMIFNVTDKETKRLYEANMELLNEYMSEFNLSPIELVKEDDTSGPYDLLNAVVDNQIEKNERDKRKEQMQQTDRKQAPKMLLDRDLKRSNEMVPYGIQVRLIALNDKKEFVQYVDFIVGVKTILHLVQSNDVVENIAKALQNQSVMFKLLKWTTGEISLFKSLILNLDEIKDMASAKGNKKSPFFQTLKRLKQQKMGVNNLTIPHGIIPNATLCISSYEAEQLMDKYGIDVLSDATAKKILSSLFLMSFIVMDDGSGIVSIMYDGDDTYQSYSIESLQKDNDRNSNKLGREIGRILSH